MKKYLKVALGVGLTVLAGAASAAAPDTTAAVSAFTDAGTAIGAIGAAMIAAAGAGIVYRWVTAFLV
jgi:hypothetical protein